MCTIRSIYSTFVVVALVAVLASFAHPDLWAEDAVPIVVKVTKKTETTVDEADGKKKALVLAVEVTAKDKLNIELADDSITLGIGEKNYRTCYIGFPAESTATFVKAGRMISTEVDQQKVFKIETALIRVPVKQGTSKFLLVFPDVQDSQKMKLEFPKAAPITLP